MRPPIKTVNNANRRYAITIDFDSEALQSELGQDYGRAYIDVSSALASLGFVRKQGTFYIGDESINAVGCVLATMELAKRLPWFNDCIRDVSMFRIEETSNLTVAVRSVREVVHAAD